MPKGPLIGTPPAVGGGQELVRAVDAPDIGGGGFCAEEVGRDETFRIQSDLALIARLVA